MDAVEDIKQRLAIEDVVGQYVELKRAGRNFKGLSPFGAERTPSFVVSPEKQIWHDFSSGRGGDMFSFVMEMEGLDFKGALEILARKAGVDLAQYQRSSDSSAATKQKERLYQLLELAAKFYQAQLKASKAAQSYVFEKRQFTKQTVLDWQLGYAPNNGRALIDFLVSKDFALRDIKAAGLTAEWRSGVRDMFRGRLMIPLCDANGRVVGFTARLLADDQSFMKEAPKYINTPATVLYDKSRHIFGFHHAKTAIRSEKYAVIAEGNLDVIMSHQAGVKTVVATAGTALTDLQLKALKRLTGDIRLSFDADKAGKNASQRAIPIASRVGVDLRVITIPSGKDPDELIKQNPEAWRSSISKAEPALDWLITRYEAELDMTSSSGKRQFRDTILAVIQALDDAVEKEHYTEVLAGKLGVSKQTLGEILAHEKAAPHLKTRKTADKPEAPAQKAAREFTRTQNRLLALVLHYPTLRGDALTLLTGDMFIGDSAQYLWTFLESNPDFTGDPSQAELLKQIGEYVKMLALQYESLYDGLELTELRYEAARLQAHLIEQYVKIQKQTLSKQLQTADEAEMEALLQKDKQLNALLRISQGGTNG